MYVEVAVLALFTFLYSVIAGRLEKLPISGPIVFVLTGLVLGPLGFGLFKDDVSQIEFRMLVDLTLALILFIDASNADTSILRSQWKIPTRMLAIGLPGAIGLGIVAAVWLLDGLTFFEAAILATMLAATDAALGKAVVSNEAVPIRLREGLNCESGLNDGLCVPILLVFIALAHGSEGGGASMALELVAAELGIGMAVGMGISAVGAWLLRKAANREWVSPIWEWLYRGIYWRTSFRPHRQRGDSQAGGCRRGRQRKHGNADVAHFRHRCHRPERSTLHV